MEDERRARTEVSEEVKRHAQTQLSHRCPVHPLELSMRGIMHVVVALSLFPVVTADAQWLNQPTPNIPRTADGKPDLASDAA